MTATALARVDHRPVDPVEPHALTPAEAAARQGVDPGRGLSAGEAAERLRTSGPNELEPPRRTSILASIVDAATEPFVIVLALSGLIAVGLGEVRDGLLILAGLLPIVGADVVTEYRAQRALEELRAAAAPLATVRRDGAPFEIAASAVVPGDVVLLRVGDVVPADLRLIACDALTIDRSALTGESLPEPATTDPDAPATALADRHSMAFAGTSVVLGRGEGIAWSTGQRTELGRIAGALDSSDRGRSPLQRELDRLVRIMLVVAIGLIVVTVGLALVRGETLGAALLAGISAAIAAIPEEPPVLLAVVLGLGAFRLLRRGVLVRRLNAQETLGAIDLIVTDKTGTLTENRLSLDSIETPDGRIDDAERRARILGDALRAEEDAWRGRSGTRTGSFTRALLGAIDEAPGGRPELDLADLLAARPPDDLRPYSWTRVRRAGGIEELALGAPEAVLALAAAGPARDRWQAAVAAAAGAGRRLLLLARREDPDGWRPLAILGFSDPIRAGIPDACGARWRRASRRSS